MRHRGKIEALLRGVLMSKKSASSESDDISRRLNAIIGLLVLESERDMGENIVTLSNAGLNSVEISKILGRTDSYIRGELSRRRNAAKK